jgi:hypothetical protein
VLFFMMIDLHHVQFPGGIHPIDITHASPIELTVAVLIKAVLAVKERSEIVVTQQRL